VQRHLAQGEYTLYPYHLEEVRLIVHHEELSPFAWGLHVYHRVAVKLDDAAPESLEEISMKVSSPPKG
jgi:hypothetical protein